jgi:recombination protein RecA
VEGCEELEAWGKRWNKSAGTDVAFAPDAQELRPGRVVTGLPALDIYLGGGFPKGRITVLYGAESSGKTLLSQLIIAAAQRKKGTAMFFDIERTYLADWFALTGVQTDEKKLIVTRPRTMEQAFDMACDALEKVRPDVLVIDSVAAMVPEAMLEAEMSERDFQGLAARKITEGIKKLNNFNQKTAIVVINQMRVDMGRSFGNPETMPGGKALRHHSSVTIHVKRGEWLTDKSEDMDEEDLSLAFTAVDPRRDVRFVGFLLRLRMEKLKMATPFQNCDIKFYFDGTVDPMDALVNLAIRRGVIEEATKGYYMLPNSSKKIHGPKQVAKRLRADDKLLAQIIKLTKEG